jgi:hypothetical protein
MAFTMVTSCPLCLALSDPEDMLDIEIERIVPKGRAHVLLCRSCGSQVIRAMAKAGEPLAQELIDLDAKEAEPTPVAPGPVSEGLNEKQPSEPAISTGAPGQERPKGQDDDNSAA